MTIEYKYKILDTTYKPVDSELIEKHQLPESQNYVLGRFIYIGPDEKMINGTLLKGSEILGILQILGNSRFADKRQFDISEYSNNSES